MFASQAQVEKKKEESSDDENEVTQDKFDIDSKLKEMESIDPLTLDLNTKFLIKNKASYNLYRGKKEVENELSEKKRREQLKQKKKKEKEKMEHELKMSKLTLK
jgi:hypothetical protein